MLAAPSSATPERCVSSCTAVKGISGPGAPASMSASPVSGTNSPEMPAARIHSGQRAALTAQSGMPATSGALASAASGESARRSERFRASISSPHSHSSWSVVGTGGTCSQGIARAGVQSSASAPASASAVRASRARGRRIGSGVRSAAARMTPLRSMDRWIAASASASGSTTGKGTRDVSRCRARITGRERPSSAARAKRGLTRQPRTYPASRPTAASAPRRFPCAMPRPPL